MSHSAKPQKDSLLIALGAVFYGTITVGARYFSDRGASLYEISLLILFMCVPLVPIVIWRPEYRIRVGDFGFFAAFGLVGAALQVTQFAGIVLGVPVAVVAVLLYSQPIWTILLGRIWLGESITRRKLLALVLAVAGVWFLIGPGGGLARYSPAGLMAALAAGFFLALFVIWGRRSRLRKHHWVTTTFGYGISSSLWLLTLLPLHALGDVSRDWLVLRPSVYADLWPAVLAFAVFAGVLPASLTFAGMKTVEASAAGILLLLEPVSAALLARVLFGEELTPAILVGGGLILVGNYVLVVSRKAT